MVLQRLRAWWRIGHAQGKILPGGWLFPGMDPMDPLTPRQLNRAVHDAASAAGIAKRVTTHTLRHSFATHLLERKVLLHVLPGGFHRIRHYGLLANGSRKASLALARELLCQPAPASTPGDVEDAGAKRPTVVCMHCGHAMVILQTFTRGLNLP